MLTLAIILEALCAIEPTQLEIDSTISDMDRLRIKENLERTVAGGVVDSRQAYPNAIFIALRGENVDGHSFVVDAFEYGAGLALIQADVADVLPVLDLRKASMDEGTGRLGNETILADLRAALVAIDPRGPVCLRVEDTLQALQKIAGYWRSKLNIRVIGITGSVGKSTTKEVVAGVLNQRYRTLKNPGNLNNEIGLPLTLLSLTEAHECAVLEMGFYIPGEIAALCKLARPQIGVITNIGTVHAERAGSKDAIARGKAELVQALPPSPEGVAVLNFDDPWVRRMAGQTQARVFFYGLSAEANLWADEVEGQGLDGIKFQLHYRRETLHLRVPLIGRHSVHTVLRAAAVGVVLGLTWQEIVNGLRSEKTQLRLVTTRSMSGALVLDDTYNASPESTLAALNLLAELDGHKIAVLGDMLELGPYEKEGHESVGMRVAEVVDELVTVGERGALIANAAWMAGLSRKKIIALSDNNQAIEYLRDHLTAEDIVLIKGSRGMQMDRIVAALEAGEREDVKGGANG